MSSSLARLMFEGRSVQGRGSLEPWRWAELLVESGRKSCLLCEVVDSDARPPGLCLRASSLVPKIPGRARPHG